MAYRIAPGIICNSDGVIPPMKMYSCEFPISEDHLSSPCGISKEKIITIADVISGKRNSPIRSFDELKDFLNCKKESFFKRYMAFRDNCDLDMVEAVNTTLKFLQENYSD